MEVDDKDYKPHKIPSRMAGKIPDSEKNGRRSRRHPDSVDAKAEAKVGFGSDDEVSMQHRCHLHGLLIKPFYGCRCLL